VTKIETPESDMVRHGNASAFQAALDFIHLGQPENSQTAVGEVEGDGSSMMEPELPEGVEEYTSSDAAGAEAPVEEEVVDTTDPLEAAGDEEPLGDDLTEELEEDDSAGAPVSPEDILAADEDETLEDDVDIDDADEAAKKATATKGTEEDDSAIEIVAPEDIVPPKEDDDIPYEDM